jgi:hypothetical protein
MVARYHDPSAFHANSAGDRGGAFGETALVAHDVSSSTFYQNSAATSGGGIELFGAGDIAELRNLVIWGNGLDVTGIANATVTNMCSQTFSSLDPSKCVRDPRSGRGRPRRRAISRSDVRVCRSWKRSRRYGRLLRVRMNG